MKKKWGRCLSLKRHDGTRASLQHCELLDRIPDIAWRPNRDGTFSAIENRKRSGANWNRAE